MVNAVSVDFDALKGELKKKGYKLTSQGRVIVDIIIQNEGEHLTAEEIYDEVKRNCLGIGLAIVYRTIILLEEMGAIYKLDLGDGCSRYGLIRDDEECRHHHLVCNKCGEVFKIEVDLLDGLGEEIKTKYGSEILDHTVRFFGVCKDCKNE